MTRSHEGWGGWGGESGAMGKAVVVWGEGRGGGERSGRPVCMDVHMCASFVYTCVRLAV